MNKKNIIIIALLAVILALLIVIIILAGKAGKKDDCNCTSKTTTENIDYKITSPQNDIGGEGYTQKANYTHKVN